MNSRLITCIKIAARRLGTAGIYKGNILNLIFSIKLHRQTDNIPTGRVIENYLLHIFQFPMMMGMSQVVGHNRLVKTVNLESAIEKLLCLF